MRSLLQKTMKLPFLGLLPLYLAVSQLFILPLMADELVNISDIKGCQEIRGDAERLLCYDTVSRGGVFNEQQLKQVQVEKFGSNSMPKTEKPVPAAVTEPEVAAKQETPPVTKTAKEPAPAAGVDLSPDRIDVTIVRVKKGGDGTHYFQTSDGQVWKQRDASSWSLEVPFDAQIKSGVLGSFFLVQKGGKSTRVNRVR